VERDFSSEKVCFDASMACTLRSCVPISLSNHDIKILVHINPKLDDRFAPIKLEADFLG
jgi:hypothetical protein